MENICYVIWKFKSPKNFVNMGGSENQLLKWITQLEKCNKKATIITHKTNNDLKYERVSKNVQIFRIETTTTRFLSMFLFMIGLFFLFIKLNRKEKFNIIHAPLPDVYIFVLFFLRLIYKIPVLTTVAGDELFPEKKMGIWRVDRLLVRYLMLKLDGIHVLNDIALEAGKKLNYDQKKLFYIPNGVKIPAEVREYSKFTHNILYIGAMRFYPEKNKREIKNLEFLIDSFNKLLNFKQGTKLYLVGDGNYRSKLEEKVLKLKLTEKIIFTGYQSNILKYHLLSDIFINPSLKEGMPNAVIEAMGTGLFVLCSDIHAHRHIIKDNVTGLLFDNSNHEDLINKILDFYNNPVKSKKIANEARLFIEENFSIDIIVENLLSMYNNINNIYCEKSQAAK